MNVEDTHSAQPPQGAPERDDAERRETMPGVAASESAEPAAGGVRRAPRRRPRASGAADSEPRSVEGGVEPDPTPSPRVEAATETARPASADVAEAGASQGADDAQSGGAGPDGDGANSSAPRRGRPNRRRGRGGSRRLAPTGAPGADGERAAAVGGAGDDTGGWGGQSPRGEAGGDASSAEPVPFFARGSWLGLNQAPQRPAPRPPRDDDSSKLHKILADAGIGSRRDMEELILAGRVSVNGQPAHVGQRVGPDDQVRVNGRPLNRRRVPQAPRVVLYHKPPGEICTRDDPGRRPRVFDQLPRLRGARWVAVGRLDLNSEGLLIFTTSGDLANRLMHPRYGWEREYAVRILGRVDDESRERLLAGVPLEDGPAALLELDDIGGDGANHWYRVVIGEGRNREVRRLFEAVGLTVSRLVRVRFGPVALPPRLVRGRWLEVGDQDVRRLARMVREAANGAAPGARGGDGLPARTGGPGGEVTDDADTTDATSAAFDDEAPFADAGVGGPMHARAGDDAAGGGRGRQRRRRGAGGGERPSGAEVASRADAIGADGSPDDAGDDEAERFATDDAERSDANAAKARQDDDTVGSSYDDHGDHGDDEDHGDDGDGLRDAEAGEPLAASGLAEAGEPGEAEEAQPPSATTRKPPRRGPGAKQAVLPDRRPGLPSYAGRAWIAGGPDPRHYGIEEPLDDVADDHEDDGQLVMIKDLRKAGADPDARPVARGVNVEDDEWQPNSDSAHLEGITRAVKKDTRQQRFGDPAFLAKTGQARGPGGASRLRRGGHAKPGGGRTFGAMPGFVAGGGGVGGAGPASKRRRGAKGVAGGPAKGPGGPGGFAGGGKGPGGFGGKGGGHRRPAGGPGGVPGSGAPRGGGRRRRGPGGGQGGGGQGGGGQGGGQGGGHGGAG